MINNVVLVLGVQQSDSVVQTHSVVPILFKFFSHLGCYRVMSRVPYALQQVLVDYPF